MGDPDSCAAWHIMSVLIGKALEQGAADVHRAAATPEKRVSRRSDSAARPLKVVRLSTM